MPASIFAGSKVKTLKSTLSLNGGADVISSTTDPTSSAVSAEPGSLLLNTTSGKLYRKNDSGSSTNWSEVGSGGAGINYITNPNAATNTTGWTTYADAAGSAPVDGAGGSPNVTFSRSTSTPLRGSADFNLVKDAANRQGEGVATDFTIDLADQAKVLQVSFDYEVLSGTYASGDLTIYLIADPAGTPIVIQPAGYQIVAGTVGTKLTARATFQTQSSGQSYRLCLHVASTSASAYTLAIDNVVVGPQITAAGAAVTDWQNYTPTGSWVTNTTYTGKYRRIGDSIQVMVKVSLSGAPTATQLQVGIPSGLSIDTSKLNSITAGENALGVAQASDTGTNGYTGTVWYFSATTVGVNSNAGGTWSSTVPFSWGNTDQLTINFIAPIAGWSSNTVMSDSSDTRVVAAQVTGAAANATALNPIIFPTVQRDTHGGYNASTGKYTIPVSGYYRVSTAMVATPAANAVLYVYADNVQQTAFLGTIATGTTAGLGSNTYFFNAGVLIDIRCSQNITGVNASSGLSIERLSGPATVAATETVAMRASNTAGTSISAPSLAQVAFATKSYDSHNAWSGSVFTAPVSGKYQVNCHVYWGSLSWTGTAKSIQVIKSGSASVTEFITLYNPTAAYTGALGLSGSTTIDVLAGDTLSITVQHNEGSARALDTTAGVNVLSITRVGN